MVRHMNGSTPRPRSSRKKADMTEELPPGLQQKHETEVVPLIASAIAEIEAHISELMELPEADEILAGGPKRLAANLRPAYVVNRLIEQEHPQAMALVSPAGPVGVSLKKDKEEHHDLARFVVPQIWWQPFFVGLAVTASMRQACFRADIGYSAALRAKAWSPTFRRLYDLSMTIATEGLEEVARQRAINGSDLLMMFMLKGAAPEKYRERVEVTSPGAVKSKAYRLAERLGIDPEELLRVANEIAGEEEVIDAPA